MNHSELAAAISAAEKTLASAVAGDLNGQYPAEAIQAYQTALASAKDVNEMADDQLTQEMLDQATAALKQAAQTFAQTVVTINYSQLNTQIAAAQAALKDAEAYKGEGPGKIPESAFTALQNELGIAQAMVKGNTHNQAGVDKEADTLAEAIKTFQESRVANDYSLLEEYVKRAEELLASVDNGEIECSQEDYDYLRASLEKNSPYLYSTDQDAINRAAKLMRRDVLLFISIVTSIDLLQAEGLDVSYYSLSGHRVSHPSRGIYIVRLTDGNETIVRKIMVK